MQFALTSAARLPEPAAIEKRTRPTITIRFRLARASGFASAKVRDQKARACAET